MFSIINERYKIGYSDFFFNLKIFFDYNFLEMESYFEYTKALITNKKIVMTKTIIFLFILLFIGCTNLFTTREDEVEKPDPGTISQVFKEPSEPAYIMVNLSRAIEGTNTLEYSKLFSNPDIVSEKHFRFFGDVNLLNQLENPWTFSQEKDYFINLVYGENNNKPSFSFSFVDSLPSRIDLAFDSVETGFLEYEMTITLSDTVKEYFGFSNFKLFKSANEAWYIYTWEDRAKNDAFEQSWTALKVENQ